MRAPSSRWTSWKWTVLDSVAVCSLTGTVISPKGIVPFQIDRAMGLPYPPRRAGCTRRSGLEHAEHRDDGHDRRHAGHRHAGQALAEQGEGRHGRDGRELRREDRGDGDAVLRAEREG